MKGQRAVRAAALIVTAFGLALGVEVSDAPSARVTISPSALPGGMVGAHYARSVTVRGPDPVYRVRVTRGELPRGLSLSPGGALKGRPSRSGSFSFGISAFASNGRTVAFREYTVRIRRAPSPFFADGFEAGLGKWNHWGPSSAFSLTSGWAGQGASLTVGPSTTGPTSSGSEMAALWLDWRAAHASAGRDTWYSARVKFPTGYQATTGQWNWFIEWHNDDATSTYSGAYSCALGIYTDYPFTSSPGINPRLAFRLMGGSVASPQIYTFTLPRNSLVRDRWYDIRVHFIWSPDPKVGLAELWLDDKHLVSKRFPTLYRHPDGTTSYNYFGLYNYRPKVSWDASIHFDRVRIGPSAASVR